MSNDSVPTTGSGVIEEVVKRPECNSHNTFHPIGSRAIAGALARMSTLGDRSHELQCVPPPPVEWQQWPDWDNGHADS